jgi:hypothetical protein
LSERSWPDTLSTHGFREDDGLALAALLDDFIKHAGKRLDKRVAFLVVADGKRELAVFLKLGDFGLEL